MNLLSRRETRLFAGHVLPDVFRARKLICPGDYTPHFIMRPGTSPAGPVMSLGNQNEGEDTIAGCYRCTEYFSYPILPTPPIPLRLLARFSPLDDSFVRALGERPEHKSLPRSRLFARCFYDRFVRIDVSRFSRNTTTPFYRIATATTTIVN